MSGIGVKRSRRNEREHLEVNVHSKINLLSEVTCGLVGWFLSFVGPTKNPREDL